MKLLYIDDETKIFKYASRLFKNIELTGVADSDEALAVLSNQDFDAVLTDNTLPGMGGIELAIKLNELYPGLPIYLTSGDYPPEVKALIGQGTLKGFFSKPFDFKLIETTILEHLS